MRGEGLDPRCEHRAGVDGAEVDRLDPEAVRGQEQFPLLLVENGERPVASELAQEGRSLFAESSDDRLSVEAAGPGNEEAIVLMGARSRRCQCAALTDDPEGVAGAEGFRHPVEAFPADRGITLSEPTAEAGHSKPLARRRAQRSSSRMICASPASGELGAIAIACFKTRAVSSNSPTL